LIKKIWHDQRALSSKCSSHANADDSGGILTRFVFQLLGSLLSFVEAILRFLLPEQQL
jgi:hypothetical protein